MYNMDYYVGGQELMRNYDLIFAEITGGRTHPMRNTTVNYTLGDILASVRDSKNKLVDNKTSIPNIIDDSDDEEEEEPVEPLRMTRSTNKLTTTNKQDIPDVIE